MTWNAHSNNERNHRRCKLNSNRFPKSINVNGKVIKKNSHIAREFNKYFIDVGSNQASKI